MLARDDAVLIPFDREPERARCGGQLNTILPKTLSGSAPTKSTVFDTLTCPHLGAGLRAVNALLKCLGGARDAADEM